MDCGVVIFQPSGNSCASLEIKVILQGTKTVFLSKKNKRVKRWTTVWYVYYVWWKKEELYESRMRRNLFTFMIHELRFRWCINCTIISILSLLVVWGSVCRHHLLHYCIISLSLMTELWYFFSFCFLCLQLSYIIMYYNFVGTKAEDSALHALRLAGSSSKIYSLIYFYNIWVHSTNYWSAPP